MPSGKNGTPMSQEEVMACLNALFILVRKNNDHIAVISGDLLATPWFSHVLFL